MNAAPFVAPGALTVAVVLADRSTLLLSFTVSVTV
jgi:hypothetical protein